MKEPFCTSGTFGSVTSIEYGAASATAMAVRSALYRVYTVCPGCPCTNAASIAVRDGTVTFATGSAGAWTAVIALRWPAVGASGAAANTTGMTFSPASICSAVRVTPAGSFSMPIASGPPKSARLATTSVA